MVDPTDESTRLEGSKDTLEVAGQSDRTEGYWSPKKSTKEGMIGPYRIEKELGSGGMGTVYLARQSRPIKREVALKLIRATVATERMIRRFEAERQALALMNHPNIAQVYDAGATDLGEPYVAMEYVDGRPLTAFCDDRQLTLGERLRLFCDICAGVQHAHQKGVVHRDLKPSNVLVAANGSNTPKIIDFGVAKALDEPLTQATLQTRGGVIGTPTYMSPEQLRGEKDVDTRADVYALGVMLYELLTGKLPHEWLSGNVLEDAQKVLTEDARPPSEAITTIDIDELTEIVRTRHTDVGGLRRQLKGDLDWITLKAMDTDRERRYASVAGLAADIQRHLDHEPVVARPPSAAYRVGRFVRRHTVGVAASLLVLIALVAGIVGTTVQARRAQREAETAHQVSQFLVDLFKVSDPSTARGEAITARELLDTSAERIEDELAEQPLVKARLLGTMADVYYNLRLIESAERTGWAALEIQRELLGESHPDVAESKSTIGVVLLTKGDNDEAESMLRSALTGLEEAYGPDDDRTAHARMNLGLTLTRQAKYEEAETNLQQAANSLRSNKDAESRTRALYYLGTLKLNAYDGAGAEPYLLEAIDWGTENLDPDHPLLGSIHEYLGVSRSMQGRNEEALASFQEGLRIKELVFDENDMRLTSALHNLATYYISVEDFESARDLLERACLILENQPVANPLAYAPTLGELALVEINLGQFAAAEDAFEKAMELMDTVVDPDHPRAIQLRMIQAELFIAKGQLDDADTVLDTCQTLMGDKEAGHPLQPDVLRGRAVIERHRGNETGALEFEAEANALKDSPEASADISED